MITEFTNYLEANRGYSHNTSLAYGNDLRNFARFLQRIHQHPRWSSVDQKDIEAYVQWMSMNAYEASTINRNISAIRQAYNWMKKEGLAPTNPARFVEMKKTQEKEPNIIPMQDLIKASKQAQGTLRVMINLLMYTGCRLQEMLDIDTKYVDYHEGSIKIQGKGKKWRKVYPPMEIMKELQAYCEGRPNKPFEGIGQREVREALYDHLKHYSSAPQLSPHAIRHTYATTLAKNGVPTTTIAQALGHTSIKTTQKYINMAEAAAQRQNLYQYIH